MHSLTRPAVLLLSLASAALLAQQPAIAPTTAAAAPNRDSSYIDAEGTAHVTRVVPIPETVSPEARRFLAAAAPDQGPPETLAQRRAAIDAYTAQAARDWQKICPVRIVEAAMAGVPVRVVTPGDMPQANSDKVLIDLHGGGFNADSGSYTESIPIASYAEIKVVAVLYRLAPEHPFPAAVDDAVAVYSELLKSYKPDHIAIYGTSAGAILTGEVAVELKKQGLPMPAALGIFSGFGDFARQGDSTAMYSLMGLTGHLDPPAPTAGPNDYAGKTGLRDPVLSPVYADLRGLPPTLFVTSGRDMLLSGTINLHRAFLDAGVDARLIVYEALPHAFWYNPQLPEAIDANHKMADFLRQHLVR